MMKCLLVLSVLLCVSLSVRGAAVRSGLCARGWDEYQGRCFRMIPYHRTWLQARAYCKNQQAQLASANDANEYAYLQRFAGLQEHTTAWMGGHIFQNTWFWDDGTEMDYSNWYKYSSSISNYPCVYLNTGAGWTNRGCTDTRPFICMRTFDNC